MLILNQHIYFKPMSPGLIPNYIDSIGEMDCVTEYTSDPIEQMQC